MLQDSAQFRPGPPYAVTEKTFTTDFNEVKSLGGDGITTPSARTADQTEIALFWYESSPLKWSRIARAVSINKGLNLWENARLFSLLNMTLADGYVAMVATRTITTTGDRSALFRLGTQTAIQTRPVTRPGHRYARRLRTRIMPRARHRAGAEVLKQVFGTDQISFRTWRDAPCREHLQRSVPVRRSYTSFSQAATENAYSRILIGFHFRKAVEEGPHTVGKSASVPSISTSGLCTELCARSPARPRICAGSPPPQSLHQTTPSWAPDQP